MPHADQSAVMKTVLTYDASLTQATYWHCASTSTRHEEGGVRELVLTNWGRGARCWRWDLPPGRKSRNRLARTATPGARIKVRLLATVAGIEPAAATSLPRWKFDPTSARFGEFEGCASTPAGRNSCCV